VHARDACPFRIVVVSRESPSARTQITSQGWKEVVLQEPPASILSDAEDLFSSLGRC
jgi:hypothetical protein